MTTTPMGVPAEEMTAAEFALQCGGAAADPELRRLGYSNMPGLDSPTPHDGPVPQPSAAFTCYEQAISAKDCDRLVDAASMVAPLVVGLDDYALGTRTPMEVRYTHDVAGIDDIVREATEFGNLANRCWWRLDVDGWDAAHVGRYEAGGPASELRWHIDGGVGRATVKAALSVQLSDGEDYEGGDLVLRMDSHMRVMPRTKGTVVVFPAWQIHCVTPVTAGVRWSLVARAFGPPLR